MVVLVKQCIADNTHSFNYVCVSCYLKSVSNTKALGPVVTAYFPQWPFNPVMSSAIDLCHCHNISCVNCGGKTLFTSMSKAFAQQAVKPVDLLSVFLFVVSLDWKLILGMWKMVTLLLHLPSVSHLFQMHLCSFHNYTVVPLWTKSKTLGLLHTCYSVIHLCFWIVCFQEY